MFPLTNLVLVRWGLIGSEIQCKHLKSMALSCLGSTIPAAGDVIVWVSISWYTLGPLAPNPTTYPSIIAKNNHLFMTTVYTSSDAKGGHINTMLLLLLLLIHSQMRLNFDLQSLCFLLSNYKEMSRNKEKICLLSHKLILWNEISRFEYIHKKDISDKRDPIAQGKSNM